MSEATIPARGPVDVTVGPHWHEVSKDEFFRRIGDMDGTSRVSMGVFVPSEHRTCRGWRRCYEPT